AGAFTHQYVAGREPRGAGDVAAVELLGGRAAIVPGDLALRRIDLDHSGGVPAVVEHQDVAVWQPGRVVLTTDLVELDAQLAGGSISPPDAVAAARREDDVALLVHVDAVDVRPLPAPPAGFDAVLHRIQQLPGVDAPYFLLVGGNLDGVVADQPRQLLAGRLV